MDDLRAKRFWKEQAKKSESVIQDLMMKYGKSMYTLLEGLRDELFEKNYVILTSDLGSRKSTDLLTFVFMMQFAAEEALRLVSVTKASEYELTPEQMRIFGQEFFTLSFDRSCEGHKEMIKKWADDFTENIRQAQATKILEKKEREFKADCRKANEELENEQTNNAYGVRETE